MRLTKDEFRAIVTNAVAEHSDQIVRREVARLAQPDRSGIPDISPPAPRAPYGSGARCATREENEYALWRQRDPAVAEAFGTFDAAMEAAEFLRALVSGDQAQLRAIDERQTRPAWLGDLRADLTTGNSAGLVPEGFWAALQVEIQRASKLRGIVQTHQGSTLSVKVPVEVNVISAEVKAELTDVRSTTDPTFGSVTLTAIKATSGTRFSAELLEDSGIALVQAVTRQSGNATGLLIDSLILGADASFTGALSDLTSNAGVTHADSDATLAHINEMYYALTEQHRARAYWLISDTFAQSLADAVDLNGRPLWSESWAPGRIFDDPAAGNVVSTLQGRPVYVFADAVIGANTCYFGDFSGYTLYERLGMQAETSRDSAFMVDGVDYKSRWRGDGVVSMASRIEKFNDVPGT